MVRLKNGIADEHLPPGTPVVVLERKIGSPAAYEVEVVDDRGRTVWWGAVDEDELESY